MHTIENPLTTPPYLNGAPRKEVSEQDRQQVDVRGFRPGQHVAAAPRLGRSPSHVWETRKRKEAENASGFVLAERLRPTLV